MFATTNCGDTAQRPDNPANGAAGCDAGQRMSALVDHLDRFVAEETSRRHPEEALGLLGHLQTRLSSHMCDLTRQATEANPDTDAVRVLKQKSRLSGRDAKRMAKVAERLPDLPKVAEALADGEITVDHAKSMADAADKVGPDAVESDPTLLEEAVQVRT